MGIIPLIQEAFDSNRHHTDNGSTVTRPSS